MTASELRDLLLVPRYRHAQDELRLQEEIALGLTAAGVAFEREVVLAPGERIDFMVESIGIEVKVAGSTHAVMRQLLRYTEHARVTALVLFTTRAQIMAPDYLGGKPIWRSLYTTL